METDILVLGLQYISVLLSFFYITFVAYQKKCALCSHLLMYSIGVLVNSLAYTFELHSETIEEALMTIRFEYFGLCTATISAVLFVCELFRVKLKKWIRCGMLVAFLVSCFMITTNEYHHLYYASASLEVKKYIAVFHMVPGPYYTIHTFITLFSMSVCVGVIIYAWFRDAKRKENYKKYLFLGLAALLPLLFWLLRLVGGLKDYDLIPFGLFCTNTFFILILYFFRYFDVAESAKNEVLETLEEGILVCDEDGRILYKNQQMNEILHNKKVKNILDVMCEMEPADEGEFLVGNRYYTVTESEVYEGEAVKGKTWCFIDMTQTKEKERQLKELHQEALAANKAKSSFLANMSHEIRTPINTILGMDELILREAQNINVIEYAQNIKNEGKTLMSLINDLLDFSKIESGKMELIETEYGVSSLLHDVVAMFSIKAEEKGLEFCVEVAEDIPSLLYGDEIRVKQILNNLLSNAVKYTERGFVKLSIGWTALDEKTARVTATVKDTGMGIRKEDLDTIFDKFKRLDEKRNNKIEGTGLGMNITAQLLKLMDGEIFIESTYGEGSEFKIQIPQVIIDATPMGAYSYKKQTAVGSKVRETFTAPNAKVLVVDDNVMNRVVVKGLLKETLLQIDEAESGEECLRKTLHHHYDIILMDHMMPGMDGVETLHRLKKQDGACRSTIVVVLTANAVVGVKEFYLEQGFDDYMSKPISGRLLEEMLLKYLPQEHVIKREVAGRINVINAKQEGFRPEEIRNVLAVERIDLNGSLERMNGKKEMYRQYAKMFASLCEERLRMLHEYIQEEDVPSYVTLVHTVKSDAKMLGAEELAALAWEQEKMGKEGDLTFLKDKFALLSAEYQRVAQCFKTLFDNLKEEGGC
ncbi:MAG: response regulator [Lachnospiraceae bacterium]|nr:response regulator [Lachnospiraceae bacterium]